MPRSQHRRLGRTSSDIASIHVSRPFESCEFAIHIHLGYSPQRIAARALIARLNFCHGFRRRPAARISGRRCKQRGRSTVRRTGPAAVHLCRGDLQWRVPAFFVELLLGKLILPRFGGTPAVWTTCLLVFQVLLLAGYALAHWMASRLAVRSQALIVLGLLGFSLILLA